MSHHVASDLGLHCLPRHIHWFPVKNELISPNVNRKACLRLFIHLQNFHTFSIRKLINARFFFFFFFFVVVVSFFLEIEECNSTQMILPLLWHSFIFANQEY